MKRKILAIIIGILLIAGGAYAAMSGGGGVGTARGGYALASGDWIGLGAAKCREVFTDTTVDTLDLADCFVQIGDGTFSWGNVSAVGDLGIEGKLEVDGVAYLDGGISVPDGKGMLIGEEATSYQGATSGFRVATNTDARRVAAFTHYRANDTMGFILALAKSQSDTQGVLAYPGADSVLGDLVFAGADEDSTRFEPGAKIRGVATELWDATGSGTKIEFYTTDDGTLTNDLRMTIDQDGTVVVPGALTGLLEGASAAGAHTITTDQAHGGFILVTAVGDVDLPDDCDSATFASVKIVVRDAGETVSVTLANSQEDTIKYPGLALTAGDEIDSPGGALDELVLVCAETNTWYANGTAGWTDGGVDD